MTTRNFFSALSLIAIFAAITSCTKPVDDVIVVDEVKPTVPDGSRIIIHFGTSTYRGCMYSFSNCIWIGWGDALALNQQDYTLLFNNGEEVGSYYGDFFPLTADCTLDPVAGMAPQTIPAGFYRFSLSPDGRRTIRFAADNRQPVSSVVNPNNPQDNLGQLHNLAVQAILGDAEIQSPDFDALRNKDLLVSKTVQFLQNEADVIIGSAEQQRIVSATFTDDYDNHQAWVAASKLSENDKKVLTEILDVASGMPVNSPEQLSHFVDVMTEFENNLVKNTSLDNPKLVLSAVSVAKHSRYFWYWKNFTTGNTPYRSDWWKADLKGLLTGGLGQAIVDSILAAIR